MLKSRSEYSMDQNTISMDQNAISLWLRENGLEVLTRSVPPASAPVLSDIKNTENTWPSTVADLDLVDPEDDDEGDDDHSDGVADDVLRVTVDQRNRPGRWEDTEVVAAAFRTAGNPKFEDVRLKSGEKTKPDPTQRELALQRAKRGNGSVEW
jgi:hypothetical protein